MMNISEKLKLIKRISGLTQQKLAGYIGVSFATLNSWINNKSLPHKKRQELIDDLYKRYTGQKIIPDDILEAKKATIHNKSKQYKNILQEIIHRKDIYDQLVLSLTYNTNSIEGSTLTEHETADILFQNISLKNRNLIEQLEAKNHQSALQFLFTQLPYTVNLNKCILFLMATEELDDFLSWLCFYEKTYPPQLSNKKIKSFIIII